VNQAVEHKQRPSEHKQTASERKQRLPERRQSSSLSAEQKALNAEDSGSDDEGLIAAPPSPMASNEEGEEVSCTTKKRTTKKRATVTDGSEDMSNPRIQAAILFMQADPEAAKEAIELMLADPEAAKQRYKDDAEVSSFLKAMADLGPDAMRRALENPESLLLGTNGQSLRDIEMSQAGVVTMQLSSQAREGATEIQVTDVTGLETGMLVVTSDGTNCELRTIVGITRDHPKRLSSKESLVKRSSSLGDSHQTSHQGQRLSWGPFPKRLSSESFSHRRSLGDINGDRPSDESTSEIFHHRLSSDGPGPQRSSGLSHGLTSGIIKIDKPLENTFTAGTPLKAASQEAMNRPGRRLDTLLMDILAEEKPVAVKGRRTTVMWADDLVEHFAIAPRKSEVKRGKKRKARLAAMEAMQNSSSDSSDGSSDSDNCFSFGRQRTFEHSFGQSRSLK